MGVRFDCFSSVLLCKEDNSTILDFDGVDDKNENLGLDVKVEERVREEIYEQRCDFYGDTLMGFPLQSEENLSLMVENECEFLPRMDYGKRLVDLELDISVRGDAIDWISKVCADYGFGPLTAYLSINYLDRFLSAYELPTGKVWMMQLLSVTCLSLAAKMEETEVPLILDLQVGDAKYVFEAKTIQRMELLVLSTLKWRMQAVTPFSFLDYFLNKFSNGNFQLRSLVSRSIELILESVRGIGLLKFRPSEIAAAVALVSLREIQMVEVNKDLASCIYVEKDRVLRCYEVVQEIALMMLNKVKRNTLKDSTPSVSSVPQSPIGVLDVTGLSYWSDETSPFGSQTNSQNTPTPASKKRKHK